MEIGHTLPLEHLAARVSKAGYDGPVRIQMDVFRNGSPSSRICAEGPDLTTAITSFEGNENIDIASWLSLPYLTQRGTLPAYLRVTAADQRLRLRASINSDLTGRTRREYTIEITRTAERPSPAV